jgi:hypothetical protein
VSRSRPATVRGGASISTVDRSTGTAPIVAAGPHPLLHGSAPFSARAATTR